MARNGRKWLEVAGNFFKEKRNAKFIAILAVLVSLNYRVRKIFFCHSSNLGNIDVTVKMHDLLHI